MTNYIAVFSLGDGVTLRIEVRHESGFYDATSLNAVCEGLAQRLGAVFLFCEEIE